MALRRKPEEGAVALSESDAIQYVWDIVDDWNKSSETWALRYGSSILGVMSAATGAYINSFYRRKLKVGQFGLMSSLLPITLLPGMCSSFFHRHFVTTSVLLNNESCTVCTEIKSAAIQGFFGLFYPLTLAPASTFLLANRYGTFRLPSLRFTPKDLFKEYKRISSPLILPLTIIVAVQMLASSLLTYHEMKNHLDIQRKLTLIEQKLQA